jgi:ADP-ribose diphosphatase
MHEGEDMERWTESEYLHKGNIFSVKVGSVRLEDGTIATREVVEHPGGVAIIPVVDDRVVLIRQYRIAIGQAVLEIPAGKLEGDESPESRGRAELEEEAGYRAGLMVPAGEIFASVGYTSEQIHLYLALDLEKTAQNLEFDERIDTVEIPLDEIRTLLANNELEDAKTVVGLERLFTYLKDHAEYG